MAEDIVTQLRGASAMTPGPRLRVCDAAAEEIGRLRGALDAIARAATASVHNGSRKRPTEPPASGSTGVQA